MLALGRFRCAPRCGAAFPLHRDPVRLRQHLAQAFGINPDDPDTNAVIHGGVAPFKSDAALTVLGALPGWGWVLISSWVPKPFRDAIYNLVARDRYRIFGKYEACFTPDASLRPRVTE